MTVEFGITWEGMDRVQQRMQRMTPNMRENAKDAISETGLNLANRQKELITGYGSVNTGDMRARTRPIFKDGGLTAIVGPAVSYALYVNGTGGMYARQPGSRMPPYKQGTSLYRWVQLHGRVQATSLKTRKTRTIQTYKSGDEIARVSFLIARSIAKKGIKAKPFVQEALTAEAPAYIQRLYKALELTMEDH